MSGRCVLVSSVEKLPNFSAVNAVTNLPYFIIAPSKPNDVAVRVRRGFSQIKVYWKKCSASSSDTMYLVTLYNGSVPVMHQQTSSERVTFSNVDKCSLWVAGVMARNLAGSSTHAYSGEFRIPAGSHFSLC